MNTDVSTDHRIALSAALQNVPKSATLAINEKSKQLQLEGKDVIRLGLGQSPFPVPDIMLQSLREYVSAKDYMAVQGYLPLREAITAFINRTEQLSRKAEDVIIGPGSKELLFGLQMVMDCDLVLPSPCWVSYEPQARLLGKTVHWLACRAEDGWKLTAESLEEHCKKHTTKQQLLILNSPNNPSGACFTEQELIALADVAKKYNLYILSDEIYSELHYQGQHQSIARYYPQGTIISNGISKWAGAGGWRLGFFIFPQNLKPILKLMIVLASETFTSVSAPIQMASICAFEKPPEMVSYIHACRKIMQSIGINFSQRLNQQQIQTVEPSGGFYNLVDFSTFEQKLAANGIHNANQLSQKMLEETGIAGLPGKDFGLQQGLLMRLAFVDFDSSSLLRQVIKDPDIVLNSETTELRRLFSAAERMGNWLHNL
ncbi:MAG: aminotransferase class I/II-fold pyridoxal phosphate-dependent enzyme [Gammaproteobacteria bacterium]|nr:aminotransferase class I/II-fold pyridoxal phosphate-dependent enzyme [Gammaproteobacteria bacterium]